MSALVVEDDLLMVESQNDGPAMVMVPPPPGMVEVTEDDGDQLMVESREAQPLAMALASPERSAVDQHQFAMAANYLKNQFAIPHHLVPSYQDISRRSGLMKRRWVPQVILFNQNKFVFTLMASSKNDGKW